MDNEKNIVYDKIIRMFANDTFYLSNFYECSVTYNGLNYLSSEAAYQAAKCRDASEKIKFTTLDADASKKLGKKVALRDDWETAKNAIMHDIVKCKFDQHPELKEKLLSTKGYYLMEGNWWRDKYWGVYPAEGTPDVDGKNMLGKILMELRDFYFYQV